MHITANLAALALKQLIGGACSVVGVSAGEGAVEGVVGFLMRHFVDHSQRLTLALRQSNDRAWKALEVALAGDSIWDRCKLVLASGEEKAFREMVRPFLAGCSLAELQGRDAYRQSCLTELRAARKAGLLTEGALEPAELARKAGTFARFSAPNDLLDAEFQALGQMGEICARPDTETSRRSWGFDRDRARPCWQWRFATSSGERWRPIMPSSRG